MSNETRVRVEFFSKIIASTWPASGASASAAPLGRPARAALRVERVVHHRCERIASGIGQVQEMPGHAAGSGTA
jgi:hypothetical protein